MAIASIPFIATLFVLAFAFHMAPSRLGRECIVSGGGFMLLFSQSESFSPLLFTIAFVLIGYVFVCLVNYLQATYIRVALSVAYILIFLFGKQYWFFPAGDFLTYFNTIGISYILLRGIYFILEVEDPRPPSLASLAFFLRYQINLFTFLSGPINRHEEFAEDEERWSEFSLSQDAIAGILLRISWGLIKIILMAPVAYHWFEVFSGGTGNIGIAPASSLFILYVYLNFSGGMDVVIAGARLFGYHLPENFDRPWMARNFIDFWSRWHITLSNFLRDTVFFPALKAVAERFPGRTALSVGNLVGGILAFTLMGLWHGTQYMFLWLGIFLALGITVNRLWEWASLDLDFGDYRWLAADLAGASAWFYFGIAAISVWPSTADLAGFGAMLARLLSLEGILGAVLTLFAIVLARRATIVVDHLPSAPQASIRYARQVLLVLAWGGVFALLVNSNSAVSTLNYYANIT